MDYSTKTLCVVDNGLFVDLAEAMAEKFGRVYLYTPWESAYPSSNVLIVGKGLAGVTRIDSIWNHLEEIDLFVFPDVYHGPLQEYLVSIGHRVWGSRMGEELELYRDFSKKVLKQAGLSVGPYKLVHGIDALREHLKEHKNQYVKISRSRADMETFKSVNYKLVEPKLDELEWKLGAKKSIMDFIVEEAIPDAVEVGYDGYSIDGQFPTQAMYGIEIKDAGYVGHFTKYDQMPEQIREINGAVADILKKYRYRNFWSAEARITEDGTPWVIDPCCRFGSPPSELATLMYTNLADIFWHGADGEVVSPESAGEWGAQAMIVSQWASKNWQPIEFPAEFRPNVRLHFTVVIDGRYYTTPQNTDLPAIGAVVAVGKTKEEAVHKVTEIAEKVEGYFLDIPVQAFEKADEEIENLKKFGITF